MCGILGYSHLRTNLPQGVLDSALASLSHRGPDQQGRFESADVSLGATRLRILDMKAGDQPLISPDGDVVLLFNGEIFNQAELRSELRSKGMQFKTHCDTEVVLNAYLHWGRQCFARLRGMFSIAFWRRSERLLLLARDRMGIKPLYYFLRHNDIFFASEVKCILAHPAVPRHMDLSALNCYLALNYVPGPGTLVEGIKKVRPGHLIEWRNGRISSSSFAGSDHTEPVPHNLPGACEHLDFLMKQAVREQLHSDVPVGIWLSGGLDSSTVLHYASQFSSAPLKTFSVTFRGRSFDESRYIRQVSRRYGTEHYELDLSPDANLAGTIEEISYYSDEPGADAGALPLWYLSQLTAKHVKVVLSGEGADELFGGYLTYKANRLRRFATMIPRRFRLAALAAAMRLPVSDDKISFEYKLKRFLRGSLLSPEAAHVFWNGTFSNRERQDIYHYFNNEPMSDLLAGITRPLELQSYLDFDQNYYLPDNILYKVDRMSMAHSLEARPPFLDHRIVEFAAQLPAGFKLSTFESKHILRKLMAGRLPAGVLKRSKIGLDIPIHDWFRGPLRGFLLDTLSEPRILRSGLFSWLAIDNLITAHLQRKANVGYHLWGLITLLLWIERWKIQPPPRSLQQSLELDANRASLVERAG